MTREEFIIKIKRDIDIFSGNIMSESNKSHLTYQEFNLLCARVSLAIEQMCGTASKEVEAAAEMAKAVIAPDISTKKKHIKKVAAMSGTVGGIGLIISGIGTALGWGAGMIATVTAAIMGSNLMPIFGQIAAGAVITLIAGYFVFHETTPEELTHRAVQALKQGIEKNIDAIWMKYESEIQKIAK